MYDDTPMHARRITGAAPTGNWRHGYSGIRRMADWREAELRRTDKGYQEHCEGKGDKRHGEVADGRRALG